MNHAIPLPLRPPKRASWVRQTVEIAAAAIVVVFVAGLLIAVLHQSGTTEQQTGGQPAIPTVQAVATASSSPTAVRDILTPTPMPTQAAAPAATPLPLSSQPLNLEQAEERARAFLDDPNSQLSGYRNDPRDALPHDGGVASPTSNLTEASVTYEISRQTPGVPYPDSVSVSELTGEIREATLPSQTLLGQAKHPVTEDEARAIAEAFARAHFVGFDNLVLHQEASLDTAAGGDVVHSVLWQTRAADSGAWLPVWVRVGVDLETGRVESFFSVRSDYAGPTMPVIDREQAIAIALDAAKNDPRLDGASVGTVELAVTAVTGDDRLGWSVQLNGVSTNSGVFILYVDAQSGAVLNPAGGPQG